MRFLLVPFLLLLCVRATQTHPLGPVVIDPRSKLPVLAPRYSCVLCVLHTVQVSRNIPTFTRTSSDGWIFILKFGQVLMVARATYYIQVGYIKHVCVCTTHTWHILLWDVAHFNTKNMQLLYTVSIQASIACPKVMC
jgi:hypothetical protein